jgi:hypothetical protein
MAANPPPPADADQYKDMRCSVCGKSCKLRCLEAHIHKFACHTEGCLLRNESVHVDTVEGVFHLWKNAPNRDPDFVAAPYGNRDVYRDPAEKEPNVEPSRHRGWEARPPSPAPDEAGRKTRRSKPPPGKAHRKTLHRSPSPDDVRDSIRRKLIRCSVCGKSCELRCLMSHMVEFACHDKDCFLHDRTVQVDIEGGLMYTIDGATHKPTPQPEPQRPPYGAGGTRYESPYGGDGPSMGPPPSWTKPFPFDARPPPYNTRPAPYNVREVSPSRDRDRTREWHHHSSRPREDKPHRSSRSRETDRRAPSPSRDPRRASAFPTRPTGNNPFSHPFNDPFDDPFFKRTPARDTRPPADHGRRRDPMESFMEQSMADMDRMMSNLGGRF